MIWQKPLIFGAVFSNKRIAPERVKFLNILQKELFMEIQNAQKKWTMSLRNCSLTISQMAIFFEGRLNDVLDL